MTEIPTPPPPYPALPTAPAGRPPRARLAVRVARWSAELATVFVGVYAAFWLNDHQAHRQERQRREQILDWLEKEYAEDLDSIKSEQTKLQKDAVEFNRALDAGEMPALHPFNFSTDYDPADTASILGGGGFDLLEVETVREIKEVEDTERTMVFFVRHDLQLSDTLILPNLEKDSGFFYDPATRKLRPTYRWYADFFKYMQANFVALRSGTEKLLTQIRAERQRNR